MLVLSRRVGETLVIDGKILVEVLRVAGNRVKIGVTAPPSCIVVRGELAPLAAPPPDQAPPRSEAA